MKLKEFYVIFYGAALLLLMWMVLHMGAETYMHGRCGDICAAKNMSYRGVFADDTCACEKGVGAIYRILNETDE